MILLQRLVVLFCVSSSFLASKLAHAALLVSIGSTTITPGGTGSIDVTVESDAALGDLLSLFSFEFRISTGGPTQLDFSNPQGDSQLGELGYVFAGDSLAAAFPPVGSVSGSIAPNDTFIGGDATFSGSDVSVLATARLLVRLDFTAATVLPPVAGDSFVVELIAGQTTAFQDSEFFDVAYEATTGTVTIVPEPSGAVMVLCGLAFVVILQAIRGRIFSA
jgi:hypothetical protein